MRKLSVFVLMVACFLSSTIIASQNSLLNYGKLVLVKSNGVKTQVNYVAGDYSSYKSKNPVLMLAEDDEDWAKIVGMVNANKTLIYDFRQPDFKKNAALFLFIGNVPPQERSVYVHKIETKHRLDRWTVKVLVSFADVYNDLKASEDAVENSYSPWMMITVKKKNIGLYGNKNNKNNKTVEIQLVRENVTYSTENVVRP